MHKLHTALAFSLLRDDQWTEIIPSWFRVRAVAYVQIHSVSLLSESQVTGHDLAPMLTKQPLLFLTRFYIAPVFLGWSP